MKEQLREYRNKRDFNETGEPEGARTRSKNRGGKPTLSFVVQEHHARRLHWDFRLEMDGVLKSWAVPKGPSLDPQVKRLAVEVEDHPLEYGTFEGRIPEHQYGAGTVYVWDQGAWHADTNPIQALRKGHLHFSLDGARLKGEWSLVRTRGKASGGKSQWLLMKKNDAYARSGDEAEQIEATKPSAPSKSAKRRTVARPSPKSEPSQATFIEPELATLVTEPPKGEQWVHETKFDGYRIQAHLKPDGLCLYTRNGNDWTAKYPGIAEELQTLAERDAILDGEVVALDERGVSSFQRLQSALKTEAGKNLLYYVFDLLALDGEDLRDLPLVARKEKLKTFIEDAGLPKIRYSDHWEGMGEDFLRVSCEHELEGIVSKRADSPYSSGRGSAWVKSKCGKRQEFVVGGYTEGKGSRAYFGALLLGVYEGSKLRYVGKVGTGFDNDGLSKAYRKMKKLEIDQTPFALHSPRMKGVHWLQPNLVAEIAFSNWTDDQRLRVPVFQGFREDKPAADIDREKPVEPSKNGKKTNPSISLSNPDKILYRKEGITKARVAEYYQNVSRFLLPHASDRPLTLVRCPNGTKQKCFFQRHVGAEADPSLERVEVPEKGGTKTYFTIDSDEGLLALVQMGAFEFHVWNARRPDILRPDQIVMDLDPGPGVKWNQVVEGALTLKELLDDLGLENFVKVTGGKGIHIHVPFAPKYSWDAVKNYARSLAHHLAQHEPKRFVAKMAKSARGGKIFVDYLRNGYGATAVAPYSLRAHERSAVAMPLTWKQLQEIESPSVFSLEEALKWLAKGRVDPWRGYASVQQALRGLPDGV